MATRGKDGSVEMVVTGDTSPLEASVAAAKAKINAEGATGKAGEGAAKVNQEVAASYQDVAASATNAATSVGSVAATTTAAASTTEKLSGSLNTAKIALNGVRAAFGAVTFVLGSLAAAYAIVTAKSEENRKKVEEANRDYLKYIDSVKRLNDEFGKQNDDKVAKRIDDVNEKFDAQADLIYRSTMADKARQEAFEKNVIDRAAALKRVYDEAEAQGRAAQSRLAADRRVQALEEENTRRESLLKQLSDEEAKAKAMEADFDKLIGMMKDYEEQASQSAKRINEAFSDSFRSIREESNRAFNTDQAATMVQLAGNLRTTATIATANMNRIVVGGDD
jgi:hypothetical protein